MPGRSDDHTRSVPRADRIDDRTTIVPMVRPPSRSRTLLPWAGFGVVAVVVVAATSMWASTLHGSDDRLLANAIPSPVVVSQVAVPAVASVTSTPVDETPVPVATTRKRVAPVAPSKPAPVVLVTTTVQPTSAAPTSVRPTKTATNDPAAIQNPTGSPCTGFFCSSPTGVGKTPASVAN